MAPVGGAVGGKPSDTTIGWIDVRLMGAKGDGSTDDTQAFRDALALAERDGGGTIFVPSGDYLIADGPLDVGSGVIVQGVSSKSAKLFDSEMGGGLFSIRDEASRFAFRSLFLVASGGHVWTSEGRCSQGHILDVVAWSYGAGHSVWHHDQWRRDPVAVSQRRTDRELPRVRLSPPRRDLPGFDRDR
jgi:hypothetical protein